MKILFINTIDNVGGAALIMRNLGQQLKQNGHDVKYIVGFKKSIDPEVHQLKKNFLANFLTKKTGLDFNFIYCGVITKFLANDIDFGASDEITSHPWYKAADIVHCNNLHGNFMKLDTIIRISNEKKMIWTLHDSWSILAHGASIIDEKIRDGFYHRRRLHTYPAMLWNNGKYLSEAKRRIYSNSFFEIVVPSKCIQDKAKHSVFKNKNINLIHNGIDTNIFKRYEKNFCRSTLGLPLDKKIILFVANSGTSNPLKGWSHIEKVMDHFKDNSNLFFLCIGGSERDEKKTGCNVKHIKYINDNNLLAQYYSASDIFLFTSLVESFGLVPIEAMSCGLPVVAFPVGIVPEVVMHKENGYIARYGDTNDLIRGVEYVINLSDKALSDISSELIDKIKNNFSLDAMTDKYLKLYNQLLKK